MAHKNLIETGHEELVEVSRIPYISGGITMPLSVAERIIQQNPEMFIVNAPQEVTLYKESARIKAEAQADLAAAGQKWEFAPPSLSERLTGHQTLQPKLEEGEKSEVVALLQVADPSNREIKSVLGLTAHVFRIIGNMVANASIPKPAKQIRSLILHGQLK